MSYIQPPSIMLEGPTGTGKTYALSTWVESTPLTLFVIITEPNGVDSLIDAFLQKDLDINRLHYKFIPPRASGIDDIEKMAKTVNRQSYEDITGIKSGVAKNETRQFFEVLATLRDFVCDRTGESYGPVEAFGPDRVLVIDSLSGINDMAMGCTIGLKPTAHQGEWGMAMNMENELFKKLGSTLHCPFVLNAHVVKQTNELTGATAIQSDALGQKLAPRLARYFSEVVLTKKTKDGKFFWSTTEGNADLKNRALPVSDSIKPDFGQIWDVYVKRCELAEIDLGTTIEKIEPKTEVETAAA